MTVSHLYKLVGTSFFEVSLVSHQVVYVITIAQEPFLEVASKTTVVRCIFTFCHNRAIEHSKEEVLQDKPIVLAFLWIIKQILTVMWIKLLNEVFFDVSFVEELLRNKMLLFEEPHENETCNETDTTFMIKLLVVRIGCKVVREACHLYSPGIPVTEFRIELLSKQVAGEYLHPMFIQFLIVRICLVADRV